MKSRMPPLLKHPSGFLPLTMSFAALATVVIHLVRFGVARQADEGADAHLWQLLMAGQAPIMAFFVARWLPQSPKQALIILAVQIVAALVAMAPVFLLGW